MAGAITAKFRNAGQRLHQPALRARGDHDTFIEKFANAVAKMKVGVGGEAGVVQGPLINQPAIEKVERHVADAVANEAKVVVGGRRHALGRTFYEPPCSPASPRRW